MIRGFVYVVLYIFLTQWFYRQSFIKLPIEKRKEIYGYSRKTSSLVLLQPFWRYHLAFLILSDESREELRKVFKWRCLLAYIFSIFTAYLCSYVIKWDMLLAFEDIFGHTVGRIIVEIGCFGFCVFQGLYILWFVANYVKGRNALSMREFLKTAELDLDKI